MIDVHEVSPDQKIGRFPFILMHRMKADAVPFRVLDERDESVFVDLHPTLTQDLHALQTHWNFFRCLFFQAI